MVKKRSRSSSSEEELADVAGSTGVVNGAAEVEGAQDAAGFIATLVDFVTGAIEAVREVMRAVRRGRTNDLRTNWLRRQGRLKIGRGNRQV